ncbi:diacylglycerol O-acyltransferase [Blastomyces gilchristii SLH14081]|uniref:O-acyltransferase n=2 Tax=Blastomyces TaxID=229219 RepID=A0A179UXI5_BLAGS|nr:diacylglycerol O-acyltransferase [Blastomyces gilchristii SLH14081]EGE81901.1 diacylglycerol O-acyltransferase [Blastomyces dermatitidis ATCC 18188]OAT12816.1 diacylglycerol O-acyltransferase [Blastomyces gilchristii SLH14081]
MARVAQIAVSPSHNIQPLDRHEGVGKNGTTVAPQLADAKDKQPDSGPQHAHPNPRATKGKYRHFAAYHSHPRVSCLSRDSETTPSFLGFRNLMVLVLIVMNLRLIVENFMKYGVLICIRCHDYRKQDVILGAILFALVPCHLFVAYVIECAAAHEVKGAIGRIKRKESEEENTQEQLAFRSAWIYIAFAHILNACLCLLFTSYAVYYYVNHPGIGTLCEVHVIVVWLKICSYAFTNRDLRHEALHSSSTSPLPEIYQSLPYPRNITVKNLTYFWLAPTLVYQPVYPRTERIRWSFVAKRVMEMIGLSVFIWLTSAQYATPVLRNSLEKIATLDLTSIIERVMKLSTISLIIWLAGFFALFQSSLNALAEVMRFGDREFYTEWWNSPSVGTYWRTWNKPVYHFMRRHIFSPLVGRGWSPFAASVVVFTFSGILHELLVGIPTHNVIGVAFAGMVLQLPLIAATLPLEKMNGPTGKIIGNCVFWVSFCLVGQPLGALLYFFAWQAKYGSVSKPGV